MPGRALEFISADQKPSLFNNIGTQCQLAKKGHKARSVLENFAAMRQRYSLLTTVDSTNKFSPGSPEPVDPPHLFILFKGNKDGSVHRALLDIPVPPWLHLQVQEVGSYREEDMIDALRILCPTLGNDTAESKVVMLDWFAAHRTPEVIAFIEMILTTMTTITVLAMVVAQGQVVLHVLVLLAAPRVTNWCQPRQRQHMQPTLLQFPGAWILQARATS